MPLVGARERRLVVEPLPDGLTPLQQQGYLTLY
jgi:hypothetical protein